MGVFVRGLWSDDFCAKNHLRKAMADASIALLGAKHPEPTITYCYGVDNHKYLSRLFYYLHRQGIDLELQKLSDEPVKMGYEGEEGKRNPRYDRHYGTLNWGWNIQAGHKLTAIREAMKASNEVVWLDWDCWQMRPLPGDFWERLASGQPLQAAMAYHPEAKKKFCPWRQSDRAGRFRTHNAFLYCRDAKIIDELLETVQQYPNHGDEQIVARWIEKQWGGWRDGDEDRWVEEGWEPFCYTMPRLYRRKRRAVFWDRIRC